MERLRRDRSSGQATKGGPGSRAVVGTIASWVQWQNPTSPSFDNEPTPRGSASKFYIMQHLVGRQVCTFIQLLQTIPDSVVYVQYCPTILYLLSLLRLILLFYLSHLDFFTRPRALLAFWATAPHLQTLPLAPIRTPAHPTARARHPGPTAHDHSVHRPVFPSSQRTPS